MVDYDSFLYDKSLKGEFVRLVQAQDMDEDEKAKIIELGIRAIMGGRISNENSIMLYRPFWQNQEF